MNVLIFGMGLQGRALAYDLEKSRLVTKIVAVDRDLAGVENFLRHSGLKKTIPLGADAASPGQIKACIEEAKADICISMLPPDLAFEVARAAIAAGIPFVSTNYTGRLTDLHEEAWQRGVAILPEMGMDPGIDLILGRLATDELERVESFLSYGTGIPEPNCAKCNSLSYKISWTFEGVLKAYQRPARLLSRGQVVTVPGEDIFNEERTCEVFIPEIGLLEAYPNGDAIHYIKVFNLSPTIQDMGRFALRWPGHSRFWKVMAELGFLEDTPLKINGVDITPRKFLVEHLTPRLQYRENERDVAIIMVVLQGIRSKQKVRLTYRIIDYRDIETGFFAMNRTVGFTASIGAQMLLGGIIRDKGLLSPAIHVPPQLFVEELAQRGMKFSRDCEVL
jgi:saccharopine dehydrogenase-like NADP-dependent oxidoreductase